MKTTAANQKNKQLAAFAKHLQQQRLSQGKSLLRTAKTLAISREQLIGLEAWDEAALPGEAFRVGLLNSYAELLGIRPIGPKQHAIKPLILPRKHRIHVLSRWLVGSGVGLLLLVIGAYLIWNSQILLAKPQLSISQPLDDSHSDNERVTIKGKTGRQTIIRIDGQPAPVAEDGSFEVERTIRSGQNNVTITAINSLGRQSTLVRHVYR